MSKMNINYFPYVHSHFDNLFTLIFMLQLLKYAEDMNSQVFVNYQCNFYGSFSTAVEETLLVELYLGIYQKPGQTSFH